MPRRKGQVRFGYRKLSTAYRTRLERQGITQEQWELGADLRTARGKAPKPPTTVEPRLVRALLEGPTPAEQLEARAAFVRPSWIPADASLDVAVALSQFPNPNRWKEVEFQARSGGEPWTMIVTPKGNGYPIAYEIPGGGGPGSGAREVLDIVTEIRNKQIDRNAAQRRAINEIWDSTVGSV